MAKVASVKSQVEHKNIVCDSNIKKHNFVISLRIIVTKKHGNAVCRNAIKRKIVASFCHVANQKYCTMPLFRESLAKKLVNIQTNLNEIKMVIGNIVQLNIAGHRSVLQCEFSKLNVASNIILNDIYTAMLKTTK